MKASRRVFIAGTLAAVSGVAAGAVSKATEAMSGNREPWDRRQAVPGEYTLISGGVLRFDNHSEWVGQGIARVHRNPSHMAPGIISARTNRHGDLDIQQTVTDTANYPIISAKSQADETLVRRGIQCGATRGTGSTGFTFFDTTLGRPLNLSNRSDRERVYGPYANLWLEWTHLDARKYGRGA